MRNETSHRRDTTPVVFTDSSTTIYVVLVAFYVVNIVFSINVYSV
jgi:hypothetical protein